MIYDSVDNFIKELPKLLPRCAELAGFLAAAREKSFEELKEMDFSPLDARFGEYITRPREAVPFEAHRKYWDLQLVLEGEELIGCAPLEMLRERTPYDEEEDIAFYDGGGQYFKLTRGMSVLLAPWDGHAPGVTAEAPSAVKKIVVKLPW
ncbi:MAG: YhcH/YjgK/YiaL family protein [Synergistaceae bacterium]|nr:YhcH/YjgK/YiaL family protein [Synergistaceae bacterium]